MLRLSIVLLAIAALVVPAGAQQPGKPRVFKSDYSVTLLGLPVAKARFESTFTTKRFNINGSLSSAGLARIFDKTDGTTTVRGSIGKDGPLPRFFSVSYTSGKKHQATYIRFANGGVEKATNMPAQKKTGERWVKVAREHLRSALDPISSTLVRADGLAQVCNRTIRIFDGEMRADLQLSHRDIGPIPGFQGEAATCTARFVPVSGYRKGRSQIEFLKNTSRITISFMPLGDTGFYAPVDASVGTQIGTLRITAHNIEAH